MPNIRIGPEAPIELLTEFVGVLSDQLKTQTGRGLVCSFRLEGNWLIFNYDFENASVTGSAAIEEGERKITRMYGNKVHAGTTGAYSIPKGKVKKALKVFMAQKGHRIRFKGKF